MIVKMAPGLDPNCVDARGRSALSSATAHGALGIMHDLLDRGADPNGAPIYHGKLKHPTPLHIASEVWSRSRHLPGVLSDAILTS